jgi:hypothetical protein
MRQLAQSGRRKESPSFGFESPLLVDTLARFDPVIVAGIRAQIPYNFALYEIGEASYRLLIGPMGVATLAVYEDAYFQKLNEKQSLLSGSERQTLFNSLGVIDGIGAGDWLLAHVPIMLEPSSPTAGVKLIAFPFSPNVPNAIVVQAFSVAPERMARSPILPSLPAL